MGYGAHPRPGARAAPTSWATAPLSSPAPFPPSAGEARTMEAPKEDAAGAALLRVDASPRVLGAEVEQGVINSSPFSHQVRPDSARSCGED